ncbi:MAG: hypothetical protein ABSD59_00020 [Terracidiphilus sp.]
MKHPTEDVLIAYLMHECADAAVIAEHLEHCRECARAFESIAETLRIFSAEPVPQANLDHVWQRIRGNLPLLSRPSRHRWSWGWLLLPAASGALLIAFIAIHHQTAATYPGVTAKLSPGSLTVQPRDPEIVSYLDSAERLLTELKHTSGPLDVNDRQQAHDLLLSNALYIRKAEDRGDTVDAAMLDRLDRTLTNLVHEQDSETTVGDQTTTESLLLDLRILEQNNRVSTKEIQ